MNFVTTKQLGHALHIVMYVNMPLVIILKIRDWILQSENRVYFSLLKNGSKISLITVDQTNRRIHLVE